MSAAAWLGQSQDTRLLKFYRVASRSRKLDASHRVVASYRRQFEKDKGDIRNRLHTVLAGASTS